MIMLLSSPTAYDQNINTILKHQQQLIIHTDHINIHIVSSNHNDSCTYKLAGCGYVYDN